MTTPPIVNVQVRKSSVATELYITARPQAPADAPAQAAELLGPVADVLRQHRAHILHERLFADAAAFGALLEAREKTLAPFAGGVAPTSLQVPPNSTGPVSGIQIHALADAEAPRILSFENRPAARLAQMPGGTSFLAAANLQADAGLPAPQQAQAMLQKAMDLLAQAGGSIHDIARTWMWLRNILDWYDPFNRVRNELFKKLGLLKEGGAGRMPASTGIGVGPLGQGACAMDFCAPDRQPAPTVPPGQRQPGCRQQVQLRVFPRRRRRHPRWRHSLHLRHRRHRRLRPDHPHRRHLGADRRHRRQRPGRPAQRLLRACRHRRGHRLLQNAGSRAGVPARMGIDPCGAVHHRGGGCVQAQFAVRDRADGDARLAAT